MVNSIFYCCIPAMDASCAISTDFNLMYLGARCLCLHILLNHIAALVLSSFCLVFLWRWIILTCWAFITFIFFIPCVVKWFTNFNSTNKYTILYLYICVCVCVCVCVSLLCSVLLICSYMFQHSCHLQGAYTNFVKTYSNKIVLQWSCLSNVQVHIQYATWGLQLCWNM